MGRDASKQLTIHVCDLIFTTSNLATTEILLQQYGKEDFLTQYTEELSLVSSIIIIAKKETQWLVH